MHWLAAVHAMPFGFSAQLRFGAVPWHVNGGTQLLSAVQLVPHAAPLHTYGEQLDVVAAAHVPAPVQCEIAVSVDPEHDAAPHVTVAAASWQAPAPLHAPVLPHGGLAAHPPRGSGLPPGTFAQLPALEPMLQAWQRPHDMLLQQTPSTQKLPVRHSALVVHACPSRRRLPQRLVCRSQIDGAKQSASDVHAARHAVLPLHTYGAHATLDAARQVPRPSHIRLVVSVDWFAGQDGAAQVVFAS